MMKAMTTVFAISLCFLCFTAKGQTISLTFSGIDNGMSVPLEKISVENLDKSCDTTLFYPNSTLVLQVMGIGDLAASPDRLIVFQNSPNPVTETTSIKIFNPVTGNISVVVMDINGKQVCSFSKNMERGYHIFDFSPGKNGTYVFSVSAKGSSRSIKVTSSVLNENGAFSLQYSGKMSDEPIRKEAMTGVFAFSVGDHLRYTGYYNSLTKVIEDVPWNNKTYTFEFIGSGFTCGQSITINHLAGEVAPVNKSTTYRTVAGIPGEPAKCWITSNLGSDHQATTVNDATEESAGWYWQFNRKQGYKHDGTTRTPDKTWITYINENSDWLMVNDPCNLELGTGWRIPTGAEWYNVYNVGGWTNWNGPWNSGLKLHAAGFLGDHDGALYHQGSGGYYWSGSGSPAVVGWYLYFGSGVSDVYYTDKANGYSARCIKDTCTIPTSPVSGSHVSSSYQIIWNWNTVTGATGYKWNTTNNYSTAADMGTATSETETGLMCNTPFNRYVWAYNACGNSTAVALNQTTSACPAPCPGTPTVSYGGQTYNTVQIGFRCWFKENLNIGTMISGPSNQTDNGVIEKYCYNNDVSNCAVYGGLYQWSEMMQYVTTAGVQGICPSGWHIPTDAEWTSMTDSLGGVFVAGGKMKTTGTIQAGTGLWYSPNYAATNERGFSAVPAGYRDIDGAFYNLGSNGYWWSSTEISGYFWILDVSYNFGGVYRDFYSKNYGFSVRCLRDF